MSPPNNKNRENNRHNNQHNIQTTTKFKHSRNRGRFYNNWDNNRQNYHYYYQHENYHNYERGTKRRPFAKKRHYKTPEKKPSRPSSPFCGTEEYTLKKIQEASDMIKRQLLMPQEIENSAQKATVEGANNDQTTENNPLDKADAENVDNGNKNNNSGCSRTNKNKIGSDNKVPQYNVGEIHEKIISHITNLSFARKMNLICSTSSGYDSVIQQIQKQKRLEVSKALREMCSNQTAENTEFINSIIPDIGIKIEDLPIEIIQELSSTLDYDIRIDEEGDNLTQISIKQEIIDHYYNNDNDESFMFQEISPEMEIEAEKSAPVPVKQELIENDKVDNNLLLEIKKEVFEIPNVEQDNVLQDFDLEPKNDSVMTVDTDPVLQESKSVQTDGVSYRKCKTIHTQTVKAKTSIFRCEFNESHLAKVGNLDHALETMYKIDKEISRLTNLRQAVFANLKKKNDPDQRIGKKRRNNKKQKIVHNNRQQKAPAQEKEENFVYETALAFQDIPEKVLVITVIRDALLAATEKGKLHYIDLRNGTTVHTVDVTGVSITSICYWMPVPGGVNLFVGCLENVLREFDFEKRTLVNSVEVCGNVQCMEICWGFVFIGTCKGDLTRLSLKKNKIEFEEKISESSVLVLKATQEGARRVLLVGTRNSPVCIRDAMSGLHMRTMDGLISPTVYSVLLESSLVYCGTTFHDILVFKFHDGELVHKYTATNSKGVSCMRIVKNLLFAGCHNGNVYVYNLNSGSYMGLIPGPGGIILSMEIVWNIKNKIEFEEKISESSVLVLKATQEGARRVLLVGTRNSPVCIRDAMSGLHMRTMDGLISPTVYSVLLESSLVYCGTTFHDILVFKFHDGELVHKYTATNSKGVSCMRIVKNLLFAGCHNGNVYVYNLNSGSYMGLIPGPGGIILSMEIVWNIVVVGTMSCNFKAILIPSKILQEGNFI